MVFPINKSLWSSSFAVFGAGVASLLVALCYWAIDVRRGDAGRQRMSSGARPWFGLSRPVWLLGWVSFFTDMASEMVYPLLPLFLTQVLGAGAMSLGVIEGAAEAANSGLKILSGWLADRWRSPKKLVLAGYGLASVVRPLIGFATAWPQVLAIRFADRLGKGIRGAPRDAMLAGFAPAETRGRVFGFHRAMDHAGAVTGPLLASAFLYFYPGDYRTLFALTIVPGVIVILFILRVPERALGEPGGTEPAEPNPASPWNRTLRNPVEPCGTWRNPSGARWRSSSSSRSATRATRSCCCGSAISASRRSGFRSCGPRSTSSRSDRRWWAARCRIGSAGGG